ncbi:MAG: DUF72 domain-containing protein [Pyrodictiaceae archaeon]
MEIYIGTSGWLYDWNKGMNLQWYVDHSGLNAVELNASFYRFPYPSQIQSWVRRGSRLRWAVKVHRLITHVRRLKASAVEVWERFYKLFKPMDDLIDFYLFQMPPSFKRAPETVERVKRFVEETGLGLRFAIEFRHNSWFDDETKKLGEKLGIVIVSVDSPQATWIIKTNDIIYLRLHGRTVWYAHNYSMNELKQLASKIISLSPRKAYIFFNNNHWMLENARQFKTLLSAMA